MKFALVTVLIALFGLGEYAFVEYYPLSPSHRASKFSNLPIVSSFVRAADEKRVRRAIEESDSGFVFISRRGTIQKWTDPAVLLADAAAGNSQASMLVRNLRDWDQITDGLTKISSRAEGGDPSAMMQLFQFGKTRSRAKEMNRGAELLRAHPSAMAQYYLSVFVNHDLDFGSKEGILLSTRVAIENYPLVRLTPDQKQQRFESAQRQLTLLQQSATNGNEGSLWVIEQIKNEGLKLEVTSH